MDTGNNIQNFGQDLTTQLYNSLEAVIGFLPQLIAGLAILLLGWIVAGTVKKLVLHGLEMINANNWLKRAGVSKKAQQDIWKKILAQLTFWTIIIIFLIPAVESWGVPRVTEVLNELLFYLPNVFAAVIIGFIGMIVSGLVHDVVKNAAKSLGKNRSNILSQIARYAVIVFAAMIILEQLGVAQRLVEIFFLMFTGALAVGTGLAFGLGGRDTAKRLLDQLVPPKK